MDLLPLQSIVFGACFPFEQMGTIPTGGNPKVTPKAWTKVVGLVVAGFVPPESGSASLEANFESPEEIPIKMPMEPLGLAGIVAGELAPFE